ncbi:uncharacterized protein VTP21DRAFT_9521 [Calcarisporiella thermophila]|uniref:uncharacterized protein n=1 Tax=Calcarisporiella thermophila TaxID=911321 RepID=UPI00374270C3
MATPVEPISLQVADEAASLQNAQDQSQSQAQPNLHIRRHLPNFNLNFPSAAQPDIIRSNQKDVYYQSILQDQISSIVQQQFGTQFQHKFQNEIRMLSDLCYFGLTTLAGTQTLGEEYCGIMQVHERTGVYPGIRRRATLIFFHTLFPYLLTKTILELKKRVRKPLPPRQARTLTTSLARKRQLLSELVHNALPRLQTFFKEHAHPIHLAVFYFFGAYYHLAKRVTGIRFIFTRVLGPGEQRIGYEVLGVLLVLQLIIRGILQRRERAKEQESKKDQGEDSEEEGLLGQSSTSSFVGDQLESNLTAEEMQARKCTLCLSPRSQTTATPCGHLFCWDCIIEWCQNKAECPLCRQSVILSHLLPLYNY